MGLSRDVDQARLTGTVWPLEAVKVFFFENFNKYFENFEKKTTFTTYDIFLCVKVPI